MISFCTAKETINKTKRQSWNGKILTTHMTDKGLTSKIYKQLIQLKNDNKRKTKQKMGRFKKKKKGRRPMETFPHTDRQ